MTSDKKGTNSGDHCERLWEENKATASRPEYTDNGRAHYIANCHDGDKFVRDLKKSGG